MRRESAGFDGLYRAKRLVLGESWCVLFFFFFGGGGVDGHEVFFVGFCWIGLVFWGAFRVLEIF